MIAQVHDPEGNIAGDQPPRFGCDDPSQPENLTAEADRPSPLVFVARQEHRVDGRDGQQPREAGDD